MSFEVGSRIGDYEIVSILGAGGMGKVFKVRNVISDRIEAMKVLLPDLEHEPELADRFMREIKVQASLQHPNIAALHTALRVENQLLMLMELVEGVTLEQRLHQGPIPLANGVDYICQVLSALGYAHQHGVIHRDIKPANMMLTPSGSVKLMDFGIAKAAADRKLTMTGTTMGSLYYMSPEQIKGMATLDARSDLYSVGVSLYEVVTGKKPFDGDSQFAIMAAHLEKEPVPPITLDTKLPQALNDVILMAIAKDANQRFQSAQAFASALGSVRQSLGMAAPVSGTATTAPLGSPAPAMPSQPAMAAPPAVVAQQPGQAPSRSSKRWLWVGAGALATALALVAVIQFGPWRKTSAQTEPQPASSPAPANPAATPAPAATTPPPADQQAATAPAAEPAPAPPVPPPVTAPATTPPPGRVEKRPVRQFARQGSTRGAAAPAAEQAQPQPAGPAANQTPPQPAGPDPAAVLQELRERLVQLDSRAGPVRTSLGNLKRSQEASGLSLRGDMAAAETRMNYQLDGANSALRAHDPAAAKKFLDSAEAEVEKLEKFLGI
ncbi:MAG TPA: serine/threonine-protein kinase [Bryobacteraceae bacterium]|nr:serine/threonine-protein kinase [Bryobacteraceae bacterium]